jgi:Mg2+ and Co2+ transporter CorA
MYRTQKHILNALNSIAEAQKELEETVSTHGKIIDSQGQDIATLEQKVMELRNKLIQAEIASGTPTKVVAEKHGISPARVSQIAPRRTYN